MKEAKGTSSQNYFTIKILFFLQIWALMCSAHLFGAKQDLCTACVPRTCICVASKGDAPPMMRPVMVPGREMMPTVLALSRMGARAMDKDDWICREMDWRGVAPRARPDSTWWERQSNIRHMNCATLSKVSDVAVYQVQLLTNALPQAL